MNAAVLKTATEQSKALKTTQELVITQPVLKGEPITSQTVSLTSVDTNEEKNAIEPKDVHTMSSKKDVAVASLPIPEISAIYFNGFWQGLFYGVIMLLILINFVSFLLFDEKIYLAYGSSLVALAAFLFFSDGLLAFFDMHNLQHVEIVKASFFLVAAIAASIFGSHYLNINTLYPKLKFLATGLFSAATMVLISGWFLENVQFAIVANILASSVVLTYFITGVLLFNQKNYAKLYVLAVVFPLLFTMDYLLSGPLSLSFLHIELAHIKGAVLVEVLVLTYAILYRMKAIKEENLIKQTELKIFLKKQEMTARQKTERHIADVYLENVIMQYDLDGFEVKLLQFISEGKTNEKIARKLKITPDELEEATNDLYQKLEIREHIKEDYHLVDSQPDFIYN
jgi:hypothetical protein